MTAMNKRELRAWLRTQHQGEAACQEQSGALCRHILESSLYKSARVIGGYMPMAHEADIRPVLADAMRQGKTVAIPLCGQKSHMTMRLVCSFEELHKGAYGLLEPSPDAPVIQAGEIDLLLVPLEGIDSAGFRLGKGGGYYDHFLAGHDVMTMGCALTWQWVDTLPVDSWDQPLHACADASGVHVFIQQTTQRKEPYHGSEEKAEDPESHEALYEG